MRKKTRIHLNTSFGWARISKHGNVQFTFTVKQIFINGRRPQQVRIEMSYTRISQHVVHHRTSNDLCASTHFLNTVCRFYTVYAIHDRFSNGTDDVLNDGD